MGSKETAITKKKETAVDNVENVSLVQFDESAMKHIEIPRISLLQALSDPVQKEGEKQGTYHNAIQSLNYGDNVEIIPVGKIRNGALFIPKGSKKMKCKSMDGITNIFGDKCAQCPFNVNYERWENNTPPECKATIDFTVLTLPEMTPALLTFKSEAHKSGKRLMTQLAWAKVPLAITMGAMQKENDKGIFYIPKVSSQRQLEAEEITEAKSWANRLSKISVAVADDEVEEDKAADMF